MFWRALALLPAIRTSLQLRGYQKTLGSLRQRAEGWCAQPSAEARNGARVEKTCRMLRAAEHYGWVRANCLEESLALWYLLRRQGIASNLRIGVRKEKEKFEAHAWVEFGGAALNQAEDRHLHYAAFEQDLPESGVERS
jgi:hypothetical protein